MTAQQPQTAASNAPQPSWLPRDYGGPVLAVLSGPTAVGKTTVLRRMRELAMPYHIGVTATTRDMRPGEEHGRDYYFLSYAEFETKLAAGDFLEHAVVHRTAHYGILRQPLRDALARGEDVLVPPDVQGAATVRRLAAGAITIFLAAPSFADLEIRIRRRGDPDEVEVQRRLTTARSEMARVDEFDYLVINHDGKLDETVHEIDAIIQAEKHRVHRSLIAI